jgi:cysteine desulfurase/selenocysteine lyase
MNSFRSRFPYFQKNKAVYLDSAATTQKPKQVIDAVTDYLQNTANPGRNPFGRSQELYEQIEEARKDIAQFFNAKSSSLAFNSGVTDGMNKLSQSLKSHLLKDQTEILLCDQDHKSTILPWLELAKQNPSIKISTYRLQPFAGLIDTQDLLSKITDKTKVVVLTHAHNVYGLINDIKSITKQLPDSVLTILDAAQTVSHTKIDFQQLGIDFMLFSGHKMFALEGIGGLISSSESSKLLHQVEFGGGVENNEYPSCIEVGTPNTIGIISLKAAVKFIKSQSISNIEKQVSDLTNCCISKLLNIPSLELLPGPCYNAKSPNTGIISFKLNEYTDTFLCKLEKNNIAIRIGNHCSNNINNQESIRISLHAYNNQEDINKFLSFF